MTDVYAFLVAFALAATLTPVVRHLALTRNIVAVPSKDRWKQSPVALLGGVALVVAFLAATAVASPPSVELWVLLVTALALAAMGLYDDLSQLRPHTKLVGQIITSAVLIEFGFRLQITDSAGVNVVVTVLWLVGITNAFNLLDNMDGLSAGVGAIAAGFSWVLCSQAGDASMAPAAAALTGALLGFVLYNFHPASIFMGDCGSMFLGLVLGGIIIAGNSGAMSGFHPLAVLVVPAFVLLIPIFDTTYVTVMRTLWGRKVSEGGRDHTSHRLVSLGLSEPQAVLVLYVLALLAGGLGLLIRFRAAWTASLLMPLYILLLAILGVYLGKASVYRSEDARQPEVATEPDTPLWQAVKYKRRIFEVLLDLLLVSAAYYGAYLLRWEGQLYGHRLETFVQSLPLAIACQMAAFWVFGVYRRMWQYTGLDELVLFLKTVAAGTGGTVLVILFAYRFETYSRSVFAIDAMLLLLLLSASRVSFRVLDQVMRGHNGSSGERVLIYGAGDAGELAVREMLNNRELGMEPVGFVDDDPLKQKARIHGFPVLGTVEDLERILRDQKATQLLLSSQRVNGARLELAERACQELNIPLKKLSLRFLDA